VSALRGVFVRLLQVMALYAPGETTLRVWLHRLRGVRIGKGSLVGLNAIIETAHPETVFIGRDVTIGIRATIIGHFRHEVAEGYSVRVEDEAFVGPGAIVLPGVTIGRGAVVAAGSVVTSSVAPMTMVQGNPARPVAKCGLPLAVKTEPADFYSQLQPIVSRRRTAAAD
jgi:acetyltransferase-like isoleucine patch superfamily enzyme